MLTMRKGVVGERNPETVSERVYNEVADTARGKKGKTCAHLEIVLLKGRPVSCNWERKIAETNEEEVRGLGEDWHQRQLARSL